MSYSSKYIKDLLYKKGHIYIGTTDPPKEVNILKTIKGVKNTIFICAINSDHTSHKLCIKKYNDNANTNVADLYKIQLELQSKLNHLPVRIPRMLGYDTEISAMIMEFIHGETLEKKIAKSFFRGQNAIESCKKYLRAVATGLASIHGIDYPETIHIDDSKSNKIFVRTLQQALDQLPVIKDCIEKSSLDLSSLLNNLPQDFWTRHEKALVFGDFQPKNVLIDDHGKIYFIDITYDIGHPLLNVSSFISQLARLQLRWVLPMTRLMIHKYQKSFLDKYFQLQGFRYLNNDLQFFRLWSIVCSLSEHLERKSMFFPYILRFYRNELNKIISDPPSYPQ